MRPPFRRRLVMVLLAGAVGVWLVFLRPGQLGGDTMYFVVVSASMEPAVPVGSLVLLREAAAYTPGDVVARSVLGFILLHRVVAVDEEGRLRTKGDALGQPDPLFVSPHEVKGKMLAAVPFLGYVTLFLSTPVGLAAAALSVVMSVVTSRGKGHIGQGNSLFFLALLAALLGGGSQPYARLVGPELALGITAGAVLLLRWLALAARGQGALEQIAWLSLLSLTLGNLAGVAQTGVVAETVSAIRQGLGNLLGNS